MGVLTDLTLNFPRGKISSLDVGSSRQRNLPKSQLSSISHHSFDRIPADLPPVITMVASEAQMPFIKNLASSGPSLSSRLANAVLLTCVLLDRKLRTASLDSLQTFLSSRKNLPTPDALKLWKGLYYALWMTDRPLPQQALAADLANLLFTLRPSCAVPWLSAFWAVMGMEWTDIDVLRMEKFLLLVRRVFAAQIRFARERAYAGPEVDSLKENVLRIWPFENDGDLKRVPVGVRLHVLDIWVDELEREGALEDPTAEGFVKDVGEMVAAMKTCTIKPVRARASENYEDERLPWGTKAEPAEEIQGGVEDEDGWGGFKD